MIFAERLNELLKEWGGSQICFAVYVGISRQTLGFYLRGERQPNIEALKKICECCEVSADWLIGLSDVKQRNPKLDDYERKLAEVGAAAFEIQEWLDCLNIRLHGEAGHD